MECAFLSDSLNTEGRASEAIPDTVHDARHVKRLLEQGTAWDQGMHRLCDEGRGSRGLVLPRRGQGLLGFVVARETVNAGLDENQTELRVLVLAVLLEVLANVDGLLDQVVQVLGQFGAQTGDLQNAKDLVAGDGTNLGNAHGVTENDTNLRRGDTLLGMLQDLFLDLVSLDLAP